jgi:hypothetical protein
MVFFRALRPLRVGVYLAVVALAWSFTAQAVPAAFEVELQGMKAPEVAASKAIDHSMLRLTSALQPVAAPASSKSLTMALLSSPGSGAADESGDGEVEIVFRGMQFHPLHTVISEGVQIRLLNDSPVALNLVSRGQADKVQRIAAGDSIRFAPGSSGVYRYGAERWSNAALRVDVAPKGRLIPMNWDAGAYRLNLKDLKEGPARLRILLGEVWYGLPEFILRQNNTLRLVVVFEPRKEGGEKELLLRERREIPVEMDEQALVPKRKARRSGKRRKKRGTKRRRRRR